MQRLSEIRALLDGRGLRPRRRFGQNFLHDHNMLRRIVDAAGLAEGDLVLEVGPGTGTLTEALRERGAHVVAAEIDRDLAELLRERFVGDAGFELVEGDCLASGRTLAPALRDALRGRPFRLVANLPYNVASALMTALLLDEPACIGQVVTIQREVAERLVAAPGGKTYGPLGIIVQALADVERVGVVPATCFWPQPKVESAIVGITPRATGRPDDAPGFARFITQLFSKRRKQLGAIFGRDRSWPEGIVPEQRPETLDGSQLQALWRTMDGEASV